MEISHQALARSISARLIIQQLTSTKFSGDVYLVGGAIREIALGRTPRDYDLAISDPDDLTRLEGLFSRRSFLLGKKPIQTHRIVTEDTVLDVNILDGTIEKDLARRDFTMNAIAFDIKKGTIIDLLRGIEDIEKKIIRYPHRSTIESDPLRMLKAIRHFATLEGFILDPELIGSITASGKLIAGTAPERVKYELDLIMLSERIAEGMEMLTKTGLIFEIIPELYALRAMDVEKKFTLETFGHTMLGFSYLNRYAQRYLAHMETVKEIGYALLFHDLGKAHTYSFDEKKKLVHFFNHERVSRDIATKIMERLRFSTHEIRTILTLIENHMRIFLISNGETTERAIRRLIYKMGDLIPPLIVLTVCDMFGSSGGQDNPSTYRVIQQCNAIMEAFHESKITPLPRLLSGDDLLSMGFKQGPLVGECLDEVRDRQIAGEINNRNEALHLAREFLKEHTRLK